LFHPAAFAAGAAEAVIASGATTVKVAELLVPDPGTVTVTEADPSESPAGTVTPIAVLVHEVGVTFDPPKETVLVPCVPPKSEPLIVTEVPTGPAAGDKLRMLGEVPPAPAGLMVTATAL
jgi:hypothetical protein